MNMKSKKTLVVLMALCFVVSLGFAQPPIYTPSELLDYYRTNEASLDPLEGIFDVVRSYNGVYEYPSTNAVVKWEGEYYVAWIWTSKNPPYDVYLSLPTSNLNKGDFCFVSNCLWTQYFSRHFNDKFSFRHLFEIDGQIGYGCPSGTWRPFQQKSANVWECYDVYPDGKTKYSYKLTKRLPITINKPIQKSTPINTWTGSGFALNNGYVVTNYHVAGEAKTIRIKGVNGDWSKTYSAVLVASDKQNDIAILKIQDSSFNGFGPIPYSLKMKTLDVGESVWALGYPMTSIMGEEIKFTDGKISARSGVEGLISLYQISVPIQPGNSGGALFDSNGNIVGITSSGLNRELNTENVNYAIKVSYLNLLIESMLDTNIIPEGIALRGQSLTTQIKLAKKYVFLIECAK